MDSESSADKHAENLATIGQLEFEPSYCTQCLSVCHTPRPSHRQLEDAMVELRGAYSGDVIK
ncbi:hypothetical protein PLICRDRAFT_41193 [Plicaturopsis crispa FD-325 SS-3]|nr:hypothetical protein PLICRDRAFT_41193 [Plicaturopsis crispa FD-325 SS-3]